MNEDTSRTVSVWDPVVRLGHWIIVVGFFTAYLSGDELLGVHVWAGYTVAAVVLIRVIWGFVGTKNARFAAFVRGPVTVIADIKGLVTGKAKRHLGHNPAGSAMIIALLIALTGTTASGMALYAAEDGRGPLAGVFASQSSAQTAEPRVAEVRSNRDSDDDDDERDEGREGSNQGEFMEALHSAFTYLTLALIALHILGVIASSFAHRENLVSAMITGRKRKPD